MADKKRRLEDLISVGPATLRDFEELRIRSLSALARQSPEGMYQRLNRLRGQHQDPCLLDVFCAAVAQARDPRLPAARCRWWWWSRRRRTQQATGRGRPRQRQATALGRSCP
ncbi:MAG TPA: helix-hairpin-helix domain-containing protein [Candidatus Cybelea sp.]|nr:helix-hairpin-helix domain-containing protein [Candidatus Cybelea sp.]